MTPEETAADLMNQWDIGSCNAFVIEGLQAAIAAAIRGARNEALEEAAGMAKKYLLVVFEADAEIRVLANDLHASIRALKDKP
jgi:hypothetical protein